MSRQRADDFTRDDLGFMQLAEARALVAVAKHQLDLNDLACRELADRGLDHRGKWVGFPKASEIYERGRTAAAARAGGVPTNVIEATITATMLMHEQRPAMNQHERRHTQLALMETVRATLSNTFLRYEPTGAGSQVTGVTVSFSGHVAE